MIIVFFIWLLWTFGAWYLATRCHPDIIFHEQPPLHNSYIFWYHRSDTSSPCVLINFFSSDNDKLFLFCKILFLSLTTFWINGQVFIIKTVFFVGSLSWDERYCTYVRCIPLQNHENYVKSHSLQYTIRWIAYHCYDRLAEWVATISIQNMTRLDRWCTFIISCLPVFIL